VDTVTGDPVTPMRYALVALNGDEALDAFVQLVERVAPCWLLGPMGAAPVNADLSTPVPKLIRDNTVQIMRSRGVELAVRIAHPTERRGLLRLKLVEEVIEFLTSADDPEEAADILEVLLALVDRDRLEAIRTEKLVERGGFARGIVWSGGEGDRR
jgi:predicted house-cleaning noncanonical NTP pyrophosphatase (MazG superfamily)